MAIKFNDYFEFPREFDMAPYTAATLAKVEGKKNITSCDSFLHTHAHICCAGMTISSDNPAAEEGDTALNEADLVDNKGEPKRAKSLQGDGSEGSKTKEEVKEVRTPGDEPGGGVSTKYQLRGVVVHNGQARLSTQHTPNTIITLWQYLYEGRILMCYKYYNIFKKTKKKTF